MTRVTTRRVVIDACKPFRRRDTFPIVVRASQEVEDHVRGKFSDVLPKGYEMQLREAGAPHPSLSPREREEQMA